MTWTILENGESASSGSSGAASRAGWSRTTSSRRRGWTGSGRSRSAGEETVAVSTGRRSSPRSQTWRALSPAA